VTYRSGLYVGFVLALWSVSALFASGRVVELGTDARVLAVSMDDASGIAWVCGSDRKTDSAVAWSIDEVEQVVTTFLTPLSTDGSSSCLDISENAAWFGGYSPIDVGFREPTMWSASAPTQPISFDPLPGPELEIWSISDTGVGIGSYAGRVYSFDVGSGLVKEFAVVDAEDYYYSQAISADGSIAAGSVLFGVPFPIVWAEAGDQVEALDNQGLHSWIQAVSPDGRRAAGGVVSSAAIWIDSGAGFEGPTIIEPAIQRFRNGLVSSATDDGLYVGDETNEDLDCNGFVWHESWPRARIFSDWVLETTGLELLDGSCGLNDVHWDGENYHFAVSSDVGLYVQTPDVANAPTFVVRSTGACPDDMTLEILGATPLARLAILRSSALGTSTLGVGLCAGVEIDLASVELVARPRADFEGRVSVTREIPTEWCGDFLQVVDLSSCELSALARVRQ